VGKLLEQLEAEFEAGWGSRRPRLSGFDGRWAVEGAVDFHSVETLGVVAELSNLALVPGIVWPA
jgi:hypothetical protein